jgi:DNA-directed RNA polymerase subunit RPC12/RpoP
MCPRCEHILIIEKNYFRCEECGKTGLLRDHPEVIKAIQLEKDKKMKEWEKSPERAALIATLGAASSMPVGRGWPMR